MTSYSNQLDLGYGYTYTREGKLVKITHSRGLTITMNEEQVTWYLGGLYEGMSSVIRDKDTIFLKSLKTGRLSSPEEKKK